MIPIHPHDDIVPAWLDARLNAAHARYVRLREVVALTGRLALHSGRTTLSGAYGVLSRFLDERLFPLVVRYATTPLVILATMLLLAPLIVFANATAFVLLGNTYLNVCSAAVSSIVLMQSLKHHREVKRMHAQHADEIAALRAEVHAVKARGSGTSPRRQQQRPVRADAEEGASR